MNSNDNKSKEKKGNDINFSEVISNFARTLKDRIDIVDHILKFEELTKQGASWQGPHSTHESENKNSNSFSINADEGYYHCFSCGEAGDLITYEQERLGVEALEAMKSLARDYSVEIPDFSKYDNLSDEERERISEETAMFQRIKELQKSYLEITEGYLQTNTEVCGYLLERGLTSESIRKFRLGFADTRTRQALANKGFTEEELEQSGLFTHRNHILADRIIIPTLDKRGRPCHFIGRTLSGDPSVPKYLAQRSQRGQNRQAVVRTFWQHGDLKDTLADDKTPKNILVVEGSIDGLLAAQHFEDQFVILSANTTTLTAAQATDLASALIQAKAVGGRSIIICNDTDSNHAGHVGALRTVRTINTAVVTLCVRDLAQKEGWGEDEEKIETMVKEQSYKMVDNEELEGAIEQNIPDCRITILRKPPEMSKIDFADYVKMGRAQEALYWIECSITPDQYDDWLLRKPIRFFTKTAKGKKGALVPMSIANEIYYEGNYFLNSGGFLFWYDSGVYRPCVDSLKVIIANKLGQEATAENIKKVYELITIMSYNPSLTVEQDLTDYQRLWVNTKSGWLDFGETPFSHEPHPHTPFRTSFSQLPVYYDPSANCPAFDSFLRDVITADDESEFVKLLGYLPVRTLKYDRAFMFTGLGGNGKSTAIELLQAFLGDQNYWLCSLHDLEVDKFASADLVGKLANFHTDLPPGYVPSGGKFKTLVAGERMRAERKYGDAFDFLPECTLVFSANEIPRSNDTSYGYYRRWVFFAFDKVFSDTSEEDVDLLEKLTTEEELSGLLNLSWLGYGKLLNENGFSESDRAKLVKKQYAEENDIVAAFVNESIEKAEGETILKSDLYDFFRTYLRARGSGREKVSAIRFNSRLRQLVTGIQESTNAEFNGRRCWTGIQLREDIVLEMEFADNAQA